MLNFINYPDTVTIYKATNVLDAWGIPTVSVDSVSAECRLTIALDSVKQTSEKSEDLIPNYAINFPYYVDINKGDMIEVDGAKYSIKKISRHRDLSGALVYSKVYI